MVIETVSGVLVVSGAMVTTLTDLTNPTPFNIPHYSYPKLSLAFPLSHLIPMIIVITLYVFNCYVKGSMTVGLQFNMFNFFR